MKRTLSQQLQRLRQNAIGSQKRRDNVTQGLCGCGRERENARWKLGERCRGSISSAPGSEMFPFNPEGKYRHPEGWVNYGATWCISLAYLQFDAMKSIPKPK